MTGAGTHDICIGNLSWISAITSACPAVPGMAAPRVPTFNLPALRSLSAVPVRPETLNRFGMMAMLGSLTASLGRSAKLPAAAGRVPDPLASLRTRLADLRAVLAAPLPPATGIPGRLALPQVQWPGGWQGSALLAASRVLAPLGIDIFSPGGGAALAAHVGRLDAQGVFARMARPGLPAGVAADLQRLGSLGSGFPLLQGRLSPQAQAPAWPGGFGGLEAFLRMGPVGLLCSPEGRTLLPSSTEIAGMTDRLRHLQFQKVSGSLLPPSLRLPGGGIADPFSAFERSGCCAVLKGIANLSAAGTGARRIEEATASLSAIRKGFGIDPAGRDAPQRLGHAVGEMERSAERLQQSLTSFLDNPAVPQTAAALSTLAQTEAEGLLHPYS